MPIQLRPVGGLPKIKERMESTLQALSDAEAVAGCAPSQRRRTLLGQLAGTMQHYLDALQGTVAEDQILYVLSPEIERRLDVARKG